MNTEICTEQIPDLWNPTPKDTADVKNSAASRGNWTNTWQRIYWELPNTAIPTQEDTWDETSGDCESMMEGIV